VRLHRWCHRQTFCRGSGLARSGKRHRWPGASGHRTHSNGRAEAAEAAAAAVAARQPASCLGGLGVRSDGGRAGAERPARPCPAKCIPRARAGANKPRVGSAGLWEMPGTQGCQPLAVELQRAGRRGSMPRARRRLVASGDGDGAQCVGGRPRPAWWRGAACRAGVNRATPARAKQGASRARQRSLRRQACARGAVGCGVGTAKRASRQSPEQGARQLGCPARTESALRSPAESAARGRRPPRAGAAVKSATASAAAATQHFGPGHAVTSGPGPCKGLMGRGFRSMYVQEKDGAKAKKGEES
jgi:hypothetical protein